MSRAIVLKRFRSHVARSRASPQLCGSSKCVAVMMLFGLRLTALYNGVDGEGDSGSRSLRRMHAELDGAVCRAYGWSDLDLEYGFHETDGGNAVDDRRLQHAAIFSTASSN